MAIDQRIDIECDPKCAEPSSTSHGSQTIYMTTNHNMKCADSTYHHDICWYGYDMIYYEYDFLDMTYFCASSTNLYPSKKRIWYTSTDQMTHLAWDTLTAKWAMDSICAASHDITLCIVEFWCDGYRTMSIWSDHISAHQLIKSDVIIAYYFDGDDIYHCDMTTFWVSRIDTRMIVVCVCISIDCDITDICTRICDRSSMLVYTQ